MEVDTKIPNAATFAIEREDHTLGNILRGYKKLIYIKKQSTWKQILIHVIL